MLKKEYKVELNTEAVARSYAVKKVFLKNSGKSQENTCARVGFLMKLEEVTPGAYLIMNLQGMVVIGGQRLKEGGTYFKIRGIIPMKFQNCNFSLPNNSQQLPFWYIVFIAVFKNYQLFTFFIVCILVPYTFVPYVTQLRLNYGQISINPFYATDLF